MQGSLHHMLDILQNPAQYSVVSEPERKMLYSSTALPPSCLSAVCVYMPWPWHHITEQRELRQLADPAPAVGSMPECYSSPRSTLSFSQCVCWQGEVAIQWSLHVWEESLPRVNPGLAGTESGQRGKKKTCQVKWYYAPRTSLRPEWANTAVFEASQSYLET